MEINRLSRLTFIGEKRLTGSNIKQTYSVESADNKFLDVIRLIIARKRL